MAYLFVNFGGPRHLDEIAPFLKELLTDRDVIRTSWPKWLHNYFFRRIAQKRALKIRPDYEMIGGKSPIYFDTENLAIAFQKKISAAPQVLTFHRYLPSTHSEALKNIEKCESEMIRVIPLFPQFSYATTGSIARFFQTHLSPSTLQKLQWIRSFATHPAFILTFQRRIREFLEQKKIAEEECILLFSAHGLPRSFITSGDSYELECQHSFEAIRQAFPKAISQLAYQSKFGRGEWLKPYTNEVCEEILSWSEGRKHVIILPLSFLSDHIETLYEIETLYLPILQRQGLESHRCPALNLENYWIENLLEIVTTSPTSKTEDLIYRPHNYRWKSF